MIPLPDEWVRSGLKLSEGVRLFGRPLSDLTRDEAIGALGHALADAKFEREERARDREMRDALRKAREAA